MTEEETTPAARDVAALQVRQVGRVQPGPDSSLPWQIIDEHGCEVLEVSGYLRHLGACDFSPASVKSYARALLRWLRFLQAVEVAWDRAGRVEVRDFVLWLRTTAKPVRRRRPGAPEPGSINRRTGKRYPGSGYAPATINHNLTVVSAFYGYQLDGGRGPLRNPVPQRRNPTGGRPNAYHNPLEPFASQRRTGYRQRVPRTAPRAIPDGLFDELFAAVPSDRDRAILALYVSTGARPAELLGLRGVDVDYGDQQIAVIRKGTRALQWLPAAADVLVWLRRYQRTLPPHLVQAEQPVWWTLRQPWRPLTYDAMRAVLRRANAELGTNWSLHDLRHTCAVRMAADPGMPLVDIQTVLGHAHLTTTQQYLAVRDDEVIARVRAHHKTGQEDRPPTVPPQPARAVGYDEGDLRELFGWQARP
jgi:integrase